MQAKLAAQSVFIDSIREDILKTNKSYTPNYHRIEEMALG